MRLISFEKNGVASFGCLVGTRTLDLRSALASSAISDRPLICETLLGLIRGGDNALATARALVTRAENGDDKLRPFIYPTTDLRILAPLPDASKIIAIGRNYRDHVSEGGSDAPDKPRLFPKWPSTIIGPGSNIVKPATTSQLDWEVELAVVIGRHASRVLEKDAMDYVAGYTIINDVSARDIQLSKPEQLALGKNFRTFTPMGSWIATCDEVPDVDDVDLRLWLNGDLMQESNTKFLIFGVRELVSFLSTVLDLEPGDIISTGTPAGVGVFRQPPVFLKSGDQLRLELSVGGSLLCELTNGVVNDE